MSFSLKKTFSAFAALLSLIVFSSVFSSQKSEDNDLISSLTFFASFDHGLDADISSGDSLLYMAPSWSDRENAVIFTGDTDHLEIREAAGRYNNALWIENSYTPVYFYRGKLNMPYFRQGWSGTVSFWLRLDPDEDLFDGFSDPIQITTRAWNDGALFVDFTDAPPRVFRFAFFPDREVWDPDMREWDDVPIDERPMIDLEEHPFSSDEWTHIAFTFQNFNTSQENCVVSGYVNGRYAGSITDREKTFTWVPEEIKIWLGYNYRGYFDELAIFNRALTSEEIELIYSLENGISDLLN